jgi:hypothetical protein
MKKIIKWIVKHKTAVVISAALLILLFVGTPSCHRLQNKIDRLNEDVNILKANNDVLINENKNITKENEKLLAENKKKDEVIKIQEWDIDLGKQEIKRLRSLRPPVLDECKPLAEAMQKEIDAWVNQFNLAIGNRDEWKAKSNNFELVCKNQVKIIENQDKIIINKDSIILDKDKIISAKDKQLALKKLEVNIYRASGAIALIAFIFMVVK